MSANIQAVAEQGNQSIPISEKSIRELVYLVSPVIVLASSTLTVIPCFVTVTVARFLMRWVLLVTNGSLRYIMEVDTS